MSQVLAVLERQNFSVEISEQWSSAALIQGQRISFGIEEPVRKVVTQKPRVSDPTDRWDYDQVVTFEPSGILALVIHSNSWETRTSRKRWSDAKVQRIEKLIPDFVAGLMRTAVIFRQREDERKQHQLKQQERAQELAQLREDIEEEEKKLKEFNDWIENWERAERMRRLITVYAEKSRAWPAEKHRNTASGSSGPLGRQTGLNPFVSERPASVLDRKQELGWG